VLLDIVEQSLQADGAGGMADQALDDVEQAVGTALFANVYRPLSMLT
jgi:hypothetical protein